MAVKNLPFLRVKVKQSEDQIRNKIASVLLKQINVKFAKMAVVIKPRVAALISDAIRSTPEYQSAISGRLRLELGLLRPQSKFEAILQRMKDSIFVTFDSSKFSNGRIRATIFVSAIPSDYSDILSLQEAKQITEKSQELEWLRWLLQEGSSTIVQGFSVIFGNFPKSSRTGGAIMIPSRGHGWSITPEFTGNNTDNFITRAITSNNFKEEFLTMILEEFNRAI